MRCGFAMARGLLAVASGRYGVVSLACLDPRHAIALNVDQAEAAVVRWIERRIAGEILRAQLVFDLRKGIFKLAAIVADIDEAAAGVLGQLAHLGGAALAEAAA